MSNLSLLNLKHKNLLSNIMLYPFPCLCKLPQKLVDVTAIRQQLLSQYDVLQSRIKDLKQAAENEVLLKY